MKPEWRTSTVYQLCQTMRISRDYSPCPILADALEDAGCDDNRLLDRLRDQALDHLTAQRLVAEIYSEETRSAVRWVDDFAAELGPHHAVYVDSDDDQEMNYTGRETTYETLMTAAADFIRHHEFLNMGNNETYKRISEARKKKFWDKYELITGYPVDWNDTDRPDNAQFYKTGTFFGCSC